MESPPGHAVTASAQLPPCWAGAVLPAGATAWRPFVHHTTPLLAGVPVHLVAARLGHADPSITVYAHVLREQVAGVTSLFLQADALAQRSDLR